MGDQYAVKACFDGVTYEGLGPSDDFVENREACKSLAYTGHYTPPTEALKAKEANWKKYREGKDKYCMVQNEFKTKTKPTDGTEKTCIINGDVFDDRSWKEALKEAAGGAQRIPIRLAMAWCGACKAMSPNLGQAQRELHAEGYDARWMDIELKENNAFLQHKFGKLIKGYPTMLLVDVTTGEAVPNGMYQGDRSSESLKKFLVDSNDHLKAEDAVAARVDKAADRAYESAWHNPRAYTASQYVYYGALVLGTLGIAYYWDSMPWNRPGRKRKDVSTDADAQKEAAAQLAPAPTLTPATNADDEDLDVKFPWETVIIILIATLAIGLVGFFIHRLSLGDDDEYDVEAPRKLESKATPSVVNA